MLKDKPDHLQNGDFVDNLYLGIKNDPNRQKRITLKMVQFTDLHLDFRYRSGANTDCGDVMCCREEHGFPTNESF